MSRTGDKEEETKGDDEADLVCLVTSGDMNAAYLDALEPMMQDVVSHLARVALECRTFLQRAEICRRVVKHVWSKGRWYRRQMNKLLLIVTKGCATAYCCPYMTSLDTGT